MLSEEARAARVDLMARRLELGLDIWTGLPLTKRQLDSIMAEFERSDRLKAAHARRRLSKSRSNIQ